MEAFELHLPPKRPKYNIHNGQFLKGHEPHNKGKKWDDYMSKRGQRRAAKGWKNLEKYRPKERPDTAGRCRKKVVGVTDDGKFRIFPRLQDAAEWCGGSRENVGRCCRHNQSRKECKHDWRPGQCKGANVVNTDHKYMGIRFYYYSDPIWWYKVPD